MHPDTFPGTIFGPHPQQAHLFFFPGRVTSRMVGLVGRNIWMKRSDVSGTWLQQASDVFSSDGDDVDRRALQRWSNSMAAFSINLSFHSHLRGFTQELCSAFFVQNVYFLFSVILALQVQHHILWSRPVTSLAHRGGEEFSERGSNFLNYVQ